MKRFIILFGLILLLSTFVFAQETYFFRPYIYSNNVYEFFTFGFGSGAAGDTIAVTNTAYYGGFYNKTDTLQITSFKCVMKHGIGTDTLQIQVQWDDSLGGTGAVKLNTADLPINSIGTGTEDTAFDNSKIPPGVWVWCTTPVVVTGRKPTMLLATLSGKRLRVK